MLSKKSILLSIAIFALSIISINAQEKNINNELKNKALKILLISDLNDSYGSTTYSDEVKWAISKIDSIKPDLILCGGDMVAGQKSTLSTENIKAMWTGFSDTVFKPISEKNIPFGFTIGNHDASPNFAKDRAEASTFWTANKQNTGLSFVDDTHFPYYFSYIKNNVFFMSWDASSSEIKPEILDWMKMQLKNKVASKARMRVLLGHLPLYSIVEAKNKNGEILANAEECLAFFKKHKIDMYVSGHQHAYYPAQKDGVKLFHLGCLGGGPRKILGHNEPAKKAYAIINIPVKKTKNFTYTGYEPVTETEIKLQHLPETVDGFSGAVNRIDKKK